MILGRFHILIIKKKVTKTRSPSLKKINKTSLWEDQSLGSRKLDHAKRSYLTVSGQWRRGRTTRHNSVQAVQSWVNTKIRRKDFKTNTKQTKTKRNSTKTLLGDLYKMDQWPCSKTTTLRFEREVWGPVPKQAPPSSGLSWPEIWLSFLAVWDYSIHKHAYLRRAHWAEGKLTFLMISVQWQVAFITGSFAHKVVFFFFFHRKSQKS